VLVFSGLLGHHEDMAVQSTSFLSITEAAELFGLNRVTILGWIRKGRINRYGPSRTKIFVLASEILHARPDSSTYPAKRVAGLNRGFTKSKASADHKPATELVTVT
jgi:excisionase family DNA binding protein